MELVDFNHFSGFEDGEDILLDTGVILAFLNEYDTWHDTVVNLFEQHIHNDDEKYLFLYVNPLIVNEVTHNIDKPMKQYAKKKGVTFTDDQIKTVRNDAVSDIQSLIEDEVLLVLDGNKQTLIKQLELFQQLGSADSVNASIANEYGINLLTVDQRLAINMKSHEQDLPNIKKVYFTDPSNISY